jgi:hypothetical protein
MSATTRTSTYSSDIKVGARYLDKQTGIEGPVTSLVFFQHGCERACIEIFDGKEIKEFYFDAARLTAVETGKTASADRPGGGSNPPSRSKRA